MSFSLKIFKEIREMKMRIDENLKFNENKLIKRNDKITIVVPTKNEEKYIWNLLKSLEKAKYLFQNLEVVVVDYNSSDKTVEIAKRNSAKIIESDRPGVGYATFVGIENAKGDIIIRCDADTILNPYALFIAVDKLRNYKIVNLGHIYYDAGFKENLMAFLFDKHWREPYHTTGHFIAFRKEITEEVNFNPELKYDDDWDFGYRAYKILGIQAFYYNYWICNFVSARRIKTTGFLRYMLGRRKR